MNQIITVSVSEEMDQDTIYISGSFTTREAGAVDRVDHQFRSQRG